MNFMLISLLVSIVVVGLIVWLLFWGLGEIGLPEPFNKIARVVIVLFAVIYLLQLLLPLAGGGKLGL